MSNPHFEKCKFCTHRGEPRKKGAFFRMLLFSHKVGKNRRADDRRMQEKVAEKAERTVVLKKQRLQTMAAITKWIFIHKSNFWT